MPESRSAVATILNNQFIDPLYPPDQAANYLGVTKQTLAVWRCTRRYDIPFIKVGRLVKYRKSALDTFLDNRTHG
ncbi:DNA binding domain-containing protein, excisionase family [Nitrosomonas aestuarii]|uniref:DNA binding domain-containing protein, excisionase family n=1 Tax=Nitrosomonas aestuarii TaxID=52441 RepID=A0A1I4D1Q5_9PROT|nr:helix-turn-helix domain-containing protein [Nitrosomonas aestuarii]SFK87432.1 DNA binding domain-containing protein, excisionase family [Nitrosomonas aestuarii]